MHMFKTARDYLFPPFPPLGMRAQGWLKSDLARRMEPCDYNAVYLFNRKETPMPTPQPAPVSDLNVALAKLADAMASELTDLQNAISAAERGDVTDAVTNLNNLVGELKQS